MSEGKMEFSSIGAVTVVHVTSKAVCLQRAGERAPFWVPMSACATPTLAKCKVGETIEAFRIETWLKEKGDL